MTKLKLTHKSTIVGAVEPLFYDLSKVERIENGQLKDFFEYHEIYENGEKPQDSCVKITFTDTMYVIFNKNWVVSFE